MKLKKSEADNGQSGPSIEKNEKKNEDAYFRYMWIVLTVISVDQVLTVISVDRVDSTFG